MMEPDMQPEMHTTSDTPETGTSAPTSDQETASTNATAPFMPPRLPAVGAHDEERQTLLATLAASRDLGPEMDHALADHYFEQRALSRSRALRRQQRMPRSFGQRARQFMRRMRERELLGPILIGAVTLAGIAGVAAFATFATLHGFPHHGPPWAGWHDPNSTQSGTNGANAQNAQHQDGPDGDGFFPFFFGFPWLIPLVLLFIFLRGRRRALAGRYQALGSQMNQGNQPYLPAGYQPPSAIEATPSTTQPTYTAYRPYDPFGASTGAPTTMPTTDAATTTTLPASAPTGVTNEVSPPPTTKPLSNPAG